ncbi:MAG: cation transporter [Cyanobacteriota bacterium]|nr:cation transporter [Cyanobacteriota bacterium]
MNSAPARAGDGAARWLGQGVLLAAKLSLVLRLGSLALLADALGSAALLLTGLSAVLLARWSDPRPDRDHPYGHTKVQALASLAITVVLAWALLELLQAGLHQLWSGGGLPFWPASWLALLLPLALAQLLVLGWRRPLAWSSALVLAALLLGSSLRLPWLDAVAALLIGALVLRDRITALRHQLPWLLDQIALAPEAIHQVAMAVPGVLNCHDIASRGVRGQQVFIDMHMVVEATDLVTAHRITELVEERLAARFGPVRCTIHLEPRDYASAAITFKGAHG